MNNVQVGAHAATQSYRDHLAARLETWRANGLERTPSVFTGGQDALAAVDGDRRLLFSSSNYLGLASHPEVLAAAHHALDVYGAGSGGSRLTTGSTGLHTELEEEIADWLGYPRCVYLATGFQANLAAISVLAAGEVTIFSDGRNHASIIDGIRFARTSGARLAVYPHRDTASLARLLASRETEHALVVTDGVFSMDGTTAPVADLRTLCDDHGALFMVDDAHGIGTLSGGRGCCAGATARPDVLVGTASKALGSEGGLICCDSTLADLLTNQARSYVFSTANSAPVIAATLAAVRLVRAGAAGVERLQSNSSYLRERLGDAGFAVPSGSAPTPIVPVPVGEEGAAMTAAAQLRDAGFHVPAIRYPTVPRDKAILRVTVMATHTRSQIDALVGHLAAHVNIA
ncbi:MAG: aminotransferase class I/II-fold pyridoxal phosphate-dependent enzyme [Mycobacteriaceae bacterium]